MKEKLYFSFLLTIEGIQQKTHHLKNFYSVELLRAKPEGPIHTLDADSDAKSEYESFYAMIVAHFRFRESAFIFSDLFSRFCMANAPKDEFLRAKGPIQTKVSLSMMIQMQKSEYESEPRVLFKQKRHSRC